MQQAPSPADARQQLRLRYPNTQTGISSFRPTRASAGLPEPARQHYTRRTFAIKLYEHCPESPPDAFTVRAQHSNAASAMKCGICKAIAEVEVRSHFAPFLCSSAHFNAAALVLNGADTKAQPELSRQTPTYLPPGTRCVHAVRSLRVRVVMMRPSVRGYAHGSRATVSAGASPRC